jgi:arylsulfatase A-like enzyme
LVIKKSEVAKNEAESYRTWILRNHEPVPPRKYLTDEFSDEAVSFISRNKDRPFFLFLSYNAPHTPLEATPKYLARFPDIKDKKRKTYAAMVSAIDDGVGLLIESLRENNLEEKTIVAFLSDNGGHTTKNASRNTPFRGAKGDVWEGGHRVPFAMQWKGTLPSGVTYDQPVSSLDFAATMVTLSGAMVSRDKPLDGVNLIPYLTGKKTGSPHEVLYLRKFDQQRFSVRRGKYKLVIPHKAGRPQLYNLDEDMGETRDLASTNPKILAELNDLRKEWSSQLMEPTFMGLIHLPSWNKNKKKK